MQPSEEIFYKKIKAENVKLQDENAKLREALKEFILAAPDCGWRKCWNCGKKQIHCEQITPSVLCRDCGSQDTRLLKKETQALKGDQDG